jgi:hypothetical protein
MKTIPILEAWMFLLVARGALDESDVEFVRGCIRAAQEEAWRKGWLAGSRGAPLPMSNPYSKKEG